MTDDALAELDAVGQADAVRRGDVTAAELVAAAYARIGARPDFNAVISTRADRAAAEAADRMDAPLAGVPFLLKELGAGLAGSPDRMGCRGLRNNAAEHDAWTTARYREAGLIVLGTTNTPEWGNHCTTEPLLTGPTLNPWAPDRSPGGSSGGSAVAVATGMVAAASGSDGTGSIRVPASCCGIVGLKPARARKSFAPGGHGLEGLVSEHALTRTVRDCAALLDLTAGPAIGDPYFAVGATGSFLAEVGEATRPPLRVLMTTDGPFGGPTDPQVRQAVEHTAHRLIELGHEVHEGAPAFDTEAVTDAVAVLHGVSNVELHNLVRDALGRPPGEDDLEPSSWQMAREGFEITGLRYAESIAAVHTQGRRFLEGLAGFDVLLVPTLLTLLPPLGHLNQPRGSVAEFFSVEFATTGWTAMANVSGCAAITLPLARSEEGWPIGVQLMAPAENVLLRLAGELERAGRL